MGVSILLYHLLAALYAQVHQVRLLVTLIGLKMMLGKPTPIRFSPV
jgi:hypothetical protein